jgi:hypothetical protein
MPPQPAASHPPRPRRRRYGGLWLLTLLLVAATALLATGQAVPLWNRLTGSQARAARQAEQALATSVSALEQACRAGNAETAVALTHPAMRAAYGPMLRDHQQELARLADLLATRELVARQDGLAEFRVTENGRTFYVTFEAIGDQWYLVAL